jgi:hypothetical protein
LSDDVDREDKDECGSNPLITKREAAFGRSISIILKENDKEKMMEKSPVS